MAKVKLQSLLVLGAVLTAVLPSVIVGWLAFEQIPDPQFRAGMLLVAMLVITSLVMVASDLRRLDGHS